MHVSGISGVPKGLMVAGFAAMALLMAVPAMAEDGDVDLVGNIRDAVQPYSRAITCAAVFNVTGGNVEAALDVARATGPKVGDDTEAKVQAKLREEMNYLNRGDRYGPPPTHDEIEDMRTDCAAAYP